MVRTYVCMSPPEIVWNKKMTNVVAAMVKPAAGGEMADTGVGSQSLRCVCAEPGNVFFAIPKGSTNIFISWSAKS